MEEEGKTAKVCSKCGEIYPSDAEFCAKDGSPLIENVKEKIEEDISQKIFNEPTEDIGGNRIARLGDRLIALIIDTLIIGAFFVAIGMWIASKMGGVTAEGFDLKGTPALIVISVSFLFTFIYYFLLEASFGVTLGKIIIGIQVVNKDGGKCSMGASFIRNLLRIVDGLILYLVGFLFAIFSKTRQRLGDRIAGTVVIEKKFHKAYRIISVILWLGGIVAGIFIAYKIHQGATNIAMTQTPASGSKISTVNMSGDLKIINFRFLQSKNGAIRPEAPYKPGDKVYTDYNVTGFTTDQGGKIHLIFTLTVFDPAGIPLYPPYKHELHQILETSNAPVNGYFNFELPEYVPSGNFNINIKIHDAVKNVVSEFMKPFYVEEGVTEISASLKFKNCQFSISPGGPPLPTPVIRAGERIYSQCIISGMRFQGEKPDTVIGVRITGPRGETIIENPELIKINNAYYYHPATFYERISANASLPSNVPRGKYTWRYTMIDRIANTKVDYEANFEVR